jgi:predicted nucleic acid-binding protein
MNLKLWAIMTLIDTSAWIEFFRKAGNRDVKRRVATLLELGQAALCGPVEFELLTGATKREMATLREAFGYCERLEFSDACWQRAAEVESRLRSKGVTVPRDDVFVCAAALVHELPLLACDQHFLQMRDRGKIPIDVLHMEQKQPMGHG